MQHDSLLNYILGMAVYYAIFLLLTGLILAKIAKYIDDKFILIIAGCLLFCIAAFRMPGVDKDSLAYITSFNFFKDPINYFTNHDDWFFFEPFYYLIPSTTRFLFGEPVYVQLTFAIFAGVALLFTFKGIYKLSSFPELSILQFFCYYFLLLEMTQIRAGVVCGLFLLAIYFHFKKNYTGFIITVLTGLLFHYTAVLMLVLLLLNTEKFNLRLYLIVGLVSVVIAFVSSDFIIASIFKLNFSFVQKMALEFASINTSENKINLFNVAFLMNVSFTAWLFIHHKKIQEKNTYTYILLKVQAIGILAFILLSPVSVIAFRVSEFLGIVNIITIPLIVYTFRSRLVGYTVIFGYSFILLLLNLQYAELLKPYKLAF